MSKPVPEFWWDFEGDSIIVESDCDKFPICARFNFDPLGGRPATGPEKAIYKLQGLQPRVGQAADAVSKAEAHIEDLKAGRRNPREMFNDY